MSTALYDEASSVPVFSLNDDSGPAQNPEPFRSFTRVAVLNRGEAAVRFLRTFRTWTRTQSPAPVAVAFFTEPDAGAPFVRLADARHGLGPALVHRPDGRVVSAYCDHERVLTALAAAGCDAVWPGWGFVAEDADFAEALEAAGITFIGPSAATLRLLGDKIAARHQAEAAGVPQAPWCTRPLHPPTPLRVWLEAAAAVGYPLMVKASAGGGGRGIRRVDRPEDLANALEAVRGEAERSFGGGGILLEACLLGGRHVEVQLAGDGRGRAWALGVRDCSIQRRHQKIIEESPSPVLPAALAAQIEAAAVRLAQRVAYRGVGTAEFLYVPATGVISFLEVNGRLQVEHPLTELLLGCDLVEAQLELALGRPWSPPTTPRGHAIEARLNAEDPARGFTPRPGRLVRFRLPAGPGIRVDTGVEEGQTIAPQFDSMIAKVIAWGATRAQACARLDGALADLDLLVEDGATNRAFLRSVLAHPAFVRGTADTAWLDRDAPALIHHHHPRAALIVAALLARRQLEAAEINRFFAEVRSGVPHHLAPPDGTVVELRLDGAHHAVRVLARSTDQYVVDVDGERHAVGFVLAGPHAARLEMDQLVHRVLFVEGEGSTSVEVDGEAHTVERAAGGVVASPMPAVVVAVAVVPGQAVAVGDVVCVLEAMKMETTLCAPVAGVVRQVAVQVHQQVGAGQTLVVLDREGNAQAPAAAAQEAATPAPATVAASVRALLSGHDVDAEEVEALRTALDGGRVEVPLAELLALFADTQALFNSQLPPSADPAASVSAELLFHDWCRRLSAVEGGPNQAVPGGFGEVLARALAHFGPLAGLDLRAVAWRLAVARAHHERRAPVVAALLRRVVAHYRQDGITRVPVATLDRIASLTAARHHSLADHARLARFVLYEQAWFARQGRALSAMLVAVVDEVLAAPAARRPSIMDCLVHSPHSLTTALLRLAGQGGPRQGPLAEALVRRLYSGRTLGAFECANEASVSATLRLAGDEAIAAVAVVMGDLDHLDDALASALRRVTVGEVVRPDRVVEILVAGQVQVAALDAAVAVCIERHPALGQTARITVTACNGHGTLRHRSFGPGWAPLAADIHPEAARRLELDRLAAFALTRLDAPEPLYAFHLRSHEAAADERIFVFADLPSATGWPGGAGWTIERAFREALGVLHEAQSARDPRRRLYGNRIYLDIQPVTTLTPRSVAAIARSLEGATRGLGLEKVVVRARVLGEDGEENPTIFNISRPGRHRLQVRAVPRTRAPIEPMTPYRLKVAAARRTGAVYPYEVLRMLCGGRAEHTEGTEDTTPHPDLVRGTFVEYDLDAEGRLGPVARPWGENRAGVVVGLITNPTPRYPEGFSRVFIASDPTHALGALAEPECRRILAALDLASELDRPVEWLPISSGARIALDSGTENLDWTARVLRRLVQHAEAGGEVNLIVHGVNVGAQSYWNAEATMLMHTRGLLIMTADGSMVLTGKKALEYSGGVSAEDERGIGGFERVMGPNGQAQCFARDLGEAWKLLFEHYRFSGRAPGERHPRPFPGTDLPQRSILATPYQPVAGEPFTCLGDIFDAQLNPERKKPFDIRQLMAAVIDRDVGHFERWAAWRDAATAVVWDAALGNTAVCLIGIESRTLPRRSHPLDGPDTWSGGTLFPQSAKKIARALNAASGNRPAVVLANLSGFDGSPESMRRLQLEYGAELGRAVVRFRGPLVFLVVGRYHGGAYVVFSKALNPNLVALAVEGSFASVIGGAPAAAVVFGREVRARAEADEQLIAARQALRSASPAERPALQEHLETLRTRLLLEHQGALARAFDGIHTVERAVAMGSLDAVIPAAQMRGALIKAIAPR